MIFVLIFCLGLLTHSLFISSMIFHHAPCFLSVGLPGSMFTPFFYYRGLCAPGEIALKNNHYYYYYYIFIFQVEMFT